MRKRWSRPGLAPQKKRCPYHFCCKMFSKEYKLMTEGLPNWPKHRYDSEKSQKQSRAHNPHVSLDRFWSESGLQTSDIAERTLLEAEKKALERCPDLLDQKRWQMPSSSLVMYRNCTLFFSAAPQRWTSLGVTHSVRAAVEIRRALLEVKYRWQIL